MFPSNPIEFQKKMFEEWEKSLGKYLEDTMRQPEFMKMVGKNLSTSMDFQGALKKNLQKWLKTWDVPTHDELAGLYKTVNSLESRVLDLEDINEDLREELAKKDQSLETLQAKHEAALDEFRTQLGGSAKKAPAKKTTAKKATKKAPSKRGAAKK